MQQNHDLWHAEKELKGELKKIRRQSVRAALNKAFEYVRYAHRTTSPLRYAATAQLCR